MADAEGVISELKNEHGLARARSRGTPLFHLQLLVGCAAINYKRLAEHAGEAVGGLATGTRDAQAALPPAAAARARFGPPAAPHANSILPRPTAVWAYTVCLN
jgi:Transposase DDE domain